MSLQKLIWAELAVTDLDEALGFDVEVELGPGNTVIVLSMAVHGFDSIGDEPLHIIAAMGWPINEEYYVDDPYAVHRAGETLNAGQRRRLVPEAG
jgi:hypothetical protein